MRAAVAYAMLPKGRTLHLVSLTRDMKARRSTEKSQQASRDAERSHREDATMTLKLLLSMMT